MSESAPKSESWRPLSEEEALEQLRAEPQIVSAELSPYIGLVESYQLNPDLETELQDLLKDKYHFFTEVVEGIRRYLKGPCIKDTFGNLHEDTYGGDGLSRRAFIRSFGKDTSIGKLFDHNRLKLGTHMNVIMTRVTLLQLGADEVVNEKLKTLFEGIPKSAYEKLSNGVELTEEEKEVWVEEMDAFSVRFLEKTAR